MESARRARAKPLIRADDSYSSAGQGAGRHGVVLTALPCCVQALGMLVHAAQGVSFVSLPIMAGLMCRCPECGEGQIFRKSLDIQRCDICGLDLRESNPGDGLATIVFLLVGAVGCLGIVWSELVLKWPVWALIVVWLPIIGLLSIVLIRPFKGLMVALLYRTQAAEAVTRWREERAAASQPVAPEARPPSDA